MLIVKLDNWRVYSRRTCHRALRTPAADMVDDIAYITSAWILGRNVMFIHFSINKPFALDQNEQATDTRL